MLLKTKNEIETKINKEFARILKEYLGEDAKSVTSEVVDDAIIVRFKEVLPLGERNLSGDPSGAKLIYELKMKLIEKAKFALESCIEQATGVKVLDTHSSFNLATGESIEIFALNKKI